MQDANGDIIVVPTGEGEAKQEKNTKKESLVAQEAKKVRL